MSRMKLGLWNLVIDDCQQALHQDPTNMKAFYQLSQAQLELKDYEASVDSARKAQELALTHNDKSLPNIMNQVRKAISARWEGKERSRVRENVHLEEEAVAMYSEQKEAALQTCASIVERKEVAAEWNRKIHLMHDVFERARSKDQQKRDPPPDWLLCDISFQVMIDPVMTRAGHSYDRQSILEHLKSHLFDPYTRERLFVTDLMPNFALKKACDAYLEENGWAAEY